MRSLVVALLIALSLCESESPSVEAATSGVDIEEYEATHIAGLWDPNYKHLPDHEVTDREAQISGVAGYTPDYYNPGDDLSLTDEERATKINPALFSITKDIETIPYSNAYKVEKVLYKTKSLFQRISVVKSKDFGHIMVIDNDLMLTERDEFHYHEMMVNVPMAYLRNASRAVVIGGGDGGTLREVLRHPNIVNATMIDIDRKVIETAKKFFPGTSVSFFHPRGTVLFADGAAWARDRCGDPDFVKVDLIIIDSTDFSAAVPLFEVSFYESMKKCVLKEGGILVHNLDSLCWDIDTVRMRTARMKTVFKHVSIYQVFQPTYSGGHYAINFASDSIDPGSSPIDWEWFEQKKLNLKYYNPNVHYAAFALPAFVHTQVPDVPAHFLERFPNRPPSRLSDYKIYDEAEDIFEPLRRERIEKEANKDEQV